MGINKEKKAFINLTKLLFLTVMLFCSNVFAEKEGLSELRQEFKNNFKNEKFEIKLPIVLNNQDPLLVYANKKDGVFEKNGLNIDLVMQKDSFSQMRDYINGVSPFFRGSLDQVIVLNDLVYDKKELRPVIISKLSRNGNGQSLVAGDDISDIKDLRGKRIAITEYSSQLYLLYKILKDNGMDIEDVEIVLTKNLMGSDSPSSELYNKNVNAAFVQQIELLQMYPDGNEDSRVLVSSKNMDNVIIEVYAVRNDVYENNKDDIQKFVHSVFLASKSLSELANDKKKKSEYNSWLEDSALFILGDHNLTTEVEIMFFEEEVSNYIDSASFFKGEDLNNNIGKIMKETSIALSNMSVIYTVNDVLVADWDWDYLRQGLDIDESFLIKNYNNNNNNNNKVSVVKEFTNNNNDDKLTKQEKDYIIEFLDKDIKNNIQVKIKSLNNSYWLIKSNWEYKDVRQFAQKEKNISRKKAEKIRDEILDYARLKNDIKLSKDRISVVGEFIDTSNISKKCVSDVCALSDDWKEVSMTLKKVLSEEYCGKVDCGKQLYEMVLSRESN